MDHIILAGFKGCGKSTLGRELAWQLGAEFVDLDTVIEEEYAREHDHLKFREIYKKVGAQGFRELETQAAQILDTKICSSRDLYVVALGGGALHNQATRKIVSQWGRVVFLNVPLEVLIERVRRKGFPAYVNVENPEQEFSDRYQQRMDGYREFSDLEVMLGKRCHRESVQLIIDRLQGKA